MTHITEITGREGDTVSMQDLFVFRQEQVTEDMKIIGQLEPTGIVPTFIEEFKRSGVTLDMGLSPSGARR